DSCRHTQMFRRALVKMFEDQDLDCVFMETHMNLKKRMHMVFECVPLPKELGDMAPIYFKAVTAQSHTQIAELMASYFVLVGGSLVYTHTRNTHAYTHTHTHTHTHCYHPTNLAWGYAPLCYVCLSVSPAGRCPPSKTCTPPESGNGQEKSLQTLHTP